MNRLKIDLNTVSGWASIFGIPFAVILSWIFFELGQERQELIFYVDNQTRTILIDEENTSGAPITVLDEQSNPVQGNVVSTKFYFWNNGKKPILFNEDVLEKAETQEKEILVAVTWHEDEPRILKYDCPIKTNQEYTGFEVSQSYINAISIRFKVMRQFEGIACQIVFEGDKYATLTIQGSLLSESRGISQDASLKKLQWIALRRKLFRALGIFLGYLGFFFILLVFPKFYKPSEEGWEATKIFLVKALRVSSLMGFAGVLILSFFRGGVFHFLFIDRGIEARDTIPPELLDSKPE